MPTNTLRQILQNIIDRNLKKVNNQAPDALKATEQIQLATRLLALPDDQLPDQLAATSKDHPLMDLTEIKNYLGNLINQDSQIVDAYNDNNLEMLPATELSRVTWLRQQCLKDIRSAINYLTLPDSKLAQFDALQIINELPQREFVWPDIN